MTDKTPAARNTGRVDIGNDLEFVWLRNRQDAEIYGFVHAKKTGVAISCSGGWWGTTDPALAAERARNVYAGDDDTEN